MTINTTSQLLSKLQEAKSHIEALHREDIEKIQNIWQQSRNNPETKQECLRRINELERNTEIHIQKLEEIKHDIDKLAKLWNNLLRSSQTPADSSSTTTPESSPASPSLAAPPAATTNPSSTTTPEPSPASPSLDAPPPISLPSLPPATISLKPENIKHYKAELRWGTYIYTVEQDLPQTTTEEDWKAIVTAYETLLNGTTFANTHDYHAGIAKLELSLDTAHETMQIAVPSELKDASLPNGSAPKTIIIPTNPIISKLTDYITRRTEGALDFFKTSFPENEEPQSPPLGLENPTGTLCYLNSLIQMILHTPHLRNELSTNLGYDELPNQYKTPKGKSPTISELNTLHLDKILFPGEPPQQRDILETLIRLLHQLNPDDPNSILTGKCTTSSYSILEKENDETIQELAKKENLIPTENGYIKREMDLILPIISLTPHPKESISIQHAITTQLLTDQPPSGDIPTITSEDKKNTFLLEHSSTQFITPPKTLIVHANRNPSDRPGIKNTGQISLTEKLSAPEKLVGQHSDYQIRSFAVHFGNKIGNGEHSASRGHYISYVKIKGQDNQTHYYELNDSHQKEISQISFLEAAKDFALAFYDRIDPPDSEEYRVEPPSAAPTEASSTEAENIPIVTTVSNRPPATLLEDQLD